MIVADKNTSAVQIVKDALEKAEGAREYHCFTFIDGEGALEKAAEIDRRIEAGEDVGKLAGVPYALKDNFLSLDGPSTASSKMLENFHSPVTASAVRKLEEAGAIMIGRTNLDAFAHGSSTESSYFGPTLNSHDKTRVAGGSSGGSAVAVALGIVPFSLGSDTGGSIRQPASYNGVIGIKPTYGTVSRYGVVAMASSTDTIGCFAKNTADVDLVMGVMAGKDEKDSTTLDDFWGEEAKSGKLKIGVITDFMGEGVDAEVKRCTDNSLEKMRGLGHEVEEVSMPILKYGLAVYYIVQTAEVASNLSRYDGIRYGYRALHTKTLEEFYGKTRDEGLMAENKRRILIGNFVLSSGFFDAYFLKAQKVRTLLIRAYEEMFKQVDILVCPVAPGVAFKLGEKVDDPVKMYLEDLMSVPPSMAGLPALSVPAGEALGGMPVGVQLIGAKKSDRTLLRLAGELI